MINTKLLMATSSALMGMFGLAITFLPQEFLELIESTQRAEIIILVQLLGAGYFGYAMLNWMSKDNMIGGTYNRPILIGNFAHFFIGCLALIKLTFVGKGIVVYTIAAFIYLIFAVLFGFLVFQHPRKKKYS